LRRNRLQKGETRCRTSSLRGIVRAFPLNLTFWATQLATFYEFADVPKFKKHLRCATYLLWFQLPIQRGCSLGPVSRSWPSRFRLLRAIGWDTRSLVRFLQPARGCLLHSVCLYGSGGSLEIWFFPGSPIWPRASSRRNVPYCRDAKNSPKATVPFSWSPSIEPLNVSVKGMGSVIDIFHDKAGPSTTPSNISVEFPSAIWRPCNILPSALSERTPRRSPKGVVTTRSQSPSPVVSTEFPMAFGWCHSICAHSTEGSGCRH
jgi:hypothetical protein